MCRLTDEGSQFYVLRSMVPSRLRAAYIIPPEAAAERALEMTIMAIITMNGEKITEGAHLQRALAESYTLAA